MVTQKMEKDKLSEICSKHTGHSITTNLAQSKVSLDEGKEVWELYVSKVDDKEAEISKHEKYFDEDKINLILRDLYDIIVLAFLKVVKFNELNHYTKLKYL
eukprot:m.325709 g.325709  ORF g.325709 m.325709 type:complete len:101 (+) comp16549_c0_seq3:296-598(+)